MLTKTQGLSPNELSTILQFSHYLHSKSMYKKEKQDPVMSATITFTCKGGKIQLKGLPIYSGACAAFIPVDRDERAVHISGYEVVVGR